MYIACLSRLLTGSARFANGLGIECFPKAILPNLDQFQEIGCEISEKEECVRSQMLTAKGDIQC